MRVFQVDGTTLSVVHRRSNRVAHFDLQTAGTRPNVRFDRGGIADFTYSLDGRHLAVGAATGYVQVIRLEDENSLMGLDIADDMAMGRYRMVSVRFAHAAEEKRCWLAMAAALFCLWNPHTQEYIYAGEEGDYRGAAFSPDGSFVASIEHHAHGLTVWNVKPFSVLFRTGLTGIGDFDNGSLAVLPDGDRIVYAAGNLLRCVSMSGGPGWETELKKPTLDLVPHPSGQSVLIADGTKKVTQIDTSNGRPAQQFDWNIGKVSCVDVSADGTLAAAGGEKGQVVVWDAE
jgi:WD40 repeat protein